MKSISLPGRVILTYGRSLMALVIARSLAQRGVEVIGCDDVALTVLSFSRHVKETFVVAPWRTEPEQFLRDIEIAVRRYAPMDDRPYVLMPVFSEIELIARHRNRFEPVIQVAAPRIASIQLVTPKDHFAAFVEASGLDAPRTWVSKTQAEFEETSKIVQYPILLKPAEGTGGRGISVAHSREEAIASSAALVAPPLLQELVEGEDYCVGVLARNGEATAIMAYRNLTTFPNGAGAGATRETVDAAPFLSATTRMLAITHWDGVAEIDFRWNGATAAPPKIIEVNARFWAGLFHSVESGVDFPWLLYRQTIGVDVTSPSRSEIGLVTKSPGIWLLAAISEVAESDPHFLAAGEAWRAAKQNMKNGDLAKALEDVGSALGEGLSLNDALDQIRSAVSLVKGAPTDLSVDDDPAVGLGTLFILSSLIRHGRLPPEVTYEAPDSTWSIKPKKIRTVIGITKPEGADGLSFFAMMVAVWIAGGSPVKVTASAPRDPHSIDGLILGGGGDVDPSPSGKKSKHQRRNNMRRGEMEKSWIAAGMRCDLPILGVCRGAQMLNVAAGGTLYPDLSKFKGLKSPKSALGGLFFRKRIEVRSGTRLAAILGPKTTFVNALHEQAIALLGAGLEVTATDPSGVIQAIEDRQRRFWVGVQFHPELLIYRARFRRLFTALVIAARERSAERSTAEQPPFYSAPVALQRISAENISVG